MKAYYVTKVIEKEGVIIIKELTEAVGHVGHISEVFFYGAGCIGNNAETMEGILKDAFPNAELEVGSDILAAAVPLCPTRPLSLPLSPPEYPPG